MIIILKDAGADKAKVIEVYHEITGESLEASKEAIDNLPVSLETMDEVGVIEAFLEAGAVIESAGKVFGDDGERVQKGIANAEIDYKDIEPDSVAKMERNELLLVLNEIRRHVITMDEYFNEIVAINSKIQAVQKQAEVLRNAVSGWVYGVLAAIVIIPTILTWSEFKWGGIVLAFIFALVIKRRLKELDASMNAKKREEEANDYLGRMLPPLKNQMVETQQSLIIIQKSEESSWAKDIIGEELFNLESIEQLINIVKSRRADSLKEALNKYDSTEHINKMEEMQRAIQNASEVAAVESAKQTAYAKETAKNTHQAATAAKATAYHTRQVSKTVKKSLK